MAAVAVVGRLSFPALGLAALAPVGAAAVAGTWVFLASRARHRRQVDPVGHPFRGGRLAAALACVVLLLGLTELGSIVVR